MNTHSLDDVKNTIRCDTDIWHLYETACGHGNLETVKWLASYYADDNLDHKKAWSMSCTNGQTGIAQWLHETYPFDVTSIVRLVFGECCRKGYLDTAKWLCTNYTFTANDFSTQSCYRSGCIYNNRIETLFHEVCHEGHIEVVEWLLQSNDTFPCIDVRFDDDVAFRMARMNCHLDLMKWLYQRYPKINVKSRGKNKKVSIETIKWLVSVSNHNSKDMGNFFCDACESNSAEVAQWLLSKYPKIQIDMHRGDSTWRVLLKSSNLDLVTLFHEIYPLNTSASQYYMYHNSDVRVTNLIANMNIHIQPIYMDSFLAGKELMVYVANWCLSYIGKEYCSESLNAQVQAAAMCNMQRTDYAFHEACIQGHLEVAKWLATHYEQHIFFADIVSRTCENGHTEVVKWLLNRHYWSSTDIQKACEKVVVNGHLDTLMWLSSRYTITCYDRTILFEKAVQNYRLNIVSWLLETYSDIDVYRRNFRVFREKYYHQTNQACMYIVDYTVHNDIKYYMKGVHKYVIVNTLLSNDDVQRNYGQDFLVYIGDHRGVYIYSATTYAPVKYAIEYIDYLANMNKKSARNQ